MSTEANITRLSDEQILYIFRAVLDHNDHADPDNDGFVVAIACAVCQATRRDFLLMRAILLVFIAKYELGRYLEPFGPQLVHHDFPAKKGTA